MKDSNFKRNQFPHIDPTSSIGENCHIGNGCIINNKVNIMNNSYIGDYTIIYGPGIINERTYVGPNCCLGHPDKIRLKTITSNSTWDKINKDSDILEIGKECIIRSGTVIYTNTKIGNRVEFGHNVMIRENVEIGDGTIVGTKTVIDGSSKIGKKVSIQTGAYICFNSTIEDAVFLGPYCVLTNDKYIMQKSTELIGPTIRRGASIGANSILMPGTIIGKGAIIGAGALVSKNVPSKTVYIGLPAKIKGTLPLGWKSLLEEKL